ncbi:hypothetical protein DFH29DRAFT_817527, partial [Suillus ampliporus]
VSTTVFSSPPDLDRYFTATTLVSPIMYLYLHARSLTLFTPSSLPRKPTSAFLLHQVLIILVASTLKIPNPVTPPSTISILLSIPRVFLILSLSTFTHLLPLHCSPPFPVVVSW